MSLANDTNPRFRMTGIALPYIDNAKTVAVTLLLNLLLAWLFRLNQYEARDIVVDAVICAWLTVVIDVMVVWHCVKKARAAGAVPQEVPVSQLMMRLPKNRFGLIAVLGVVFTALCVGINHTVFSWFGFESWTFGQFLLYKLVYSLILSERIVSLGILRLVQPDCRQPDDVHTTPIAQPVAQPIKYPLPGLNGIRELFSTVSANLAIQLFFNPYLGEYTFGGARSIIAEGVIASAVTCFIVVGMLTKTLDMARANGEFHVPPNRWLMIWPKNRWGFACLCTLAAAPIAATVFVTLFQLYGFTSWTFYEFFWVKMAYLTALSRILVAATIRRFTQPDIFGERCASRMTPKT